MELGPANQRAARFCPGAIPNLACCCERSQQPVQFFKSRRPTANAATA